MKEYTILIIEDNAITRKMLRVTLECEHYHVLIAEDGKTALEQARTGKPDLILQDLILPDIDGIELNRQLRALLEVAEIPILALSGFLSKMEEIQHSHVGFTGFILKPVEPSHLVEILKSYLPLTDTADHPIAQGRNILLVDDNSIQLKLLKIQLSNSGFNVDTATDGQNALEKIQTRAYDVVVSDVLMPHMDGFELCFTIRNNPQLAHLPVILVTSHYLEDADKALAKSVAATAYLTRTADAKELIKTLDKVLLNPVSPKKITSAKFFKEEHMHRLIRQMEQQIITNRSLEQRCALQAAQLSLLGDVTDALTKSSNIENSLQNVLTICLDAAGISKGILYVLDSNGKLKLMQKLGYASAKNIELETFFTHPQLFNAVLANRTILQIPSSEISEEIAKHFLSDAQVTTALLIPLLFGEQCLGVLFLGSKSINVVESSPLAFARMLGIQLGQAVALATAFERISDSEKRYRLLMENASCGIFIAAPDRKILEINKEFEKIIGDSRQNLIGKDFFDFVVASEHESSQLLIQKVLNEKKIGPNFGHMQNKNGKIQDIEFSVALIEINDKKLMFSILNDVTERNNLRSQALLNDKLATVGTLAAGIAHEINNPTAWVLSNLSYLAKHMADLKHSIIRLSMLNQETDVDKKLRFLDELSSDVKQQQLILKFDEIINESIQGAERIRDIVANLKGFARIDESPEKPIDVNETLSNVINMAFPEIKYRAWLEKDFATNLPMICFNSGKLHQVFLNIIMNAAQAIPEGDPAHNKIQIKTQIEEDQIRVDIRDTGIGIPANILDKIFDPFFTTKPVGTGTGLGLYICHEILHNLGGKITVVSAPKQGSTFSVFLPLELAKKTQKKPALSANSLKTGSAAPKQMLIVDDEEFFLKSLNRMLEKQHNVTTALGGRAALDLLKQKAKNFDVIITDLHMPDIDGIDLYRYVSEKYPALKSRMIFMTGGAYTKSMKDFLAEVTNQRLEKPFTQNEIVEAIDKIFETT